MILFGRQCLRLSNSLEFAHFPSDPGSINRSVCNWHEWFWVNWMWLVDSSELGYSQCVFLQTVCNSPSSEEGSTMYNVHWTLTRFKYLRMYLKCMCICDSIIHTIHFLNISCEAGFATFNSFCQLLCEGEWLIDSMQRRHSRNTLMKTLF